MRIKAITSFVRSAADLRSITGLLPRLCLVGIAAIVITFESGRCTEMDPTLERNLFLIETAQSEPSPIASARLAAAGLSVSSDQSLKVFLYFDHVPNSEDYTFLNTFSIRSFPFTYLPPVGFHPYGVMLAEGRASAIRSLQLSGVYPRMAAGGRKLSPKNDLAAEETGVSAARNWETPLTGRGVRLAILDSGFNFDHPDLPDPAESMDYSAYPDTNRDATDQISGHGTHVAGTAFGNGQQSHERWMGMAPDVEPIYFKIGDDSTADATSEAILGAIRGAATWADADILSMSYGGLDGFNDGTSVEDHAVDWAVGEGVSVFMSAGNSSGEAVHYSEIIRAHATSDPIQVVVRSAPDTATWGFSVIWFDGSDTSIHRDIVATLFDSNNRAVGLDVLPGTSSLRGTEHREYMSQDFLPADTSSFLIRITNNSGVDQKVHLWTQSSHWFVRFSRPDRATTVLLPSTADSCISVGAFTSRTSWRDFEGVDRVDRTVRGEIAAFSSIGPRIDGLQKPDICAPGRRLISCRDDDNIIIGQGLDYAIVSTDGDSGLPAEYVTFMGTSMSSPAAAGVAALILEAEPDLNPSRLRERIFRTTRRDEQTGRVPNAIWGWGKIDVVGALEVKSDQTGQKVAPVIFQYLTTYPTPSNGSVIVGYEVEIPSELKVKVYDPNGRSVWNSTLAKSTPGRKTLSIPEEVIDASGVYLLELSGGNQKATARVTIVR